MNAADELPKNIASGGESIINGRCLLNNLETFQQYYVFTTYYYHCLILDKINQNFIAKPLSHHLMSRNIVSKSMTLS